MKFEWDDKKNTLNHEKHKVWFEEAQTMKKEYDLKKMKKKLVK